MVPGPAHEPDNPVNGLARCAWLTDETSKARAVAPLTLRIVELIDGRVMKFLASATKWNLCESPQGSNAVVAAGSKSTASRCVPDTDQLHIVAKYPLATPANNPKVRYALFLLSRSDCQNRPV